MSDTLTESVALGSARYDVPAPVSPRGTVVVLPGRGEDVAVYERFGRRIAADGYTIEVLGSNESSSADSIESAVEKVVGAAVPPVVLVGSDTGALQVLGVLPTALRVAAAVLAGLPVTGSGPGVAAWDAELEARTACPAHRARLNGDDRLVRGALGEPVAADLLASLEMRPTVPLLVIHGSADVVAPLVGTRSWVAEVPGASLAMVNGGRHDVLNDLSHRSVAAHVVLFLERLRSDPALAPIVVVHEPPR